MLLESGFISKACQASSRTSSLLPVASFAEVCYSNTGGRSGTLLAGARLRSLRTWSKTPSAEGFLRTLQGGSRGISYGGLIKAFRGQLLQRHEKSSGVGLYSSDGLINPPPGKIRFGVAKVLLVVRKKTMKKRNIYLALEVFQNEMSRHRKKEENIHISSFKDLNLSCRLVVGWCLAPTLQLTSASCWKTLSTSVKKWKMRTTEDELPV